MLLIDSRARGDGVRRVFGALKRQAQTEYGSVVQSRLRFDWVGIGRGRGVWPLADTLAAIVIVGVFWLPQMASAGGVSRALPGAVLAVVTAVAMILRRRVPSLATVAAAIATVAGTLLAVSQDPMLATAWCLYPLAVERAARTSPLVVGLACGFVGLTAVTAVPAGDTRVVWERVIVAVGALSVSGLLGTTVGRQISTAREAERARVQLEVAREVHDVVGHALSVISAEASITRSLPDAEETELRQALGDVEAHAREALQEVQALVRGLRDAPSPPAISAGKATGAMLLSSLIASARAAGLSIDARIDVSPDVGNAVHLVVFRIVQEAVSNVLRHAPGAACTVDVREVDEAIVVRVRDHGSAGEGTGMGAGSGLGLQGLRERALIVRGTVEWRRHPAGGFEVSARLPVRGAG